MEFLIDVSPSAAEQLDALTARERATLLDMIDIQLRYQPTFESRNRKPLDPNELASWELRVGDLRVFYDVQTDPKPVIWVRAVGRKVHNRLLIGGKEFEL